MESSDYVGCFINDSKSGHFGIIRANVAAQNRAAGRYTCRASRLRSSSSVGQKCTCYVKPNHRKPPSLLGASLDVLAKNHHLVDFYDLPDFFVGEVLLSVGVKTLFRPIHLHPEYLGCLKYLDLRSNQKLRQVSPVIFNQLKVIFEVMLDAEALGVSPSCTKLNRCERKDCHRPAKINFALPVPGIQEVLFQMMDGTKNSVESNKDPKTDSESLSHCSSIVFDLALANSSKAIQM
ncbi:unnamed protein product [Oikopleura dioica]|uniref:Uncharacterized protein n=1 Tax=Oikopleura dioica TaxID=34765 RepID=E4X7U0_OIKDI|nr:unnamed protein product [Oikopleura dioica]